MEYPVFKILEKYNFWNNQEIPQGYLRPSYLKTLQNYCNNSLIKVVLGQRRSGKSHLLRMIINHLVTQLQVARVNILYINKELHDFEAINNAQSLFDAIDCYRKALNPQGKVYLFLDEVQEIEGWEKAVNSLAQDHHNQVELFITGSNAHLLSGELATFLSGRYLTLTVFPFDYDEYLQVFNLNKSKSTVLQYLQEGGMSELYQLPNPETKRNYIHSLLDSIVLRDIVHRNKIREVFLLEKLIHFTIDSVGSMLSVPSIVKTLSQHGFKSNAETIGNYLSFCENAFFLHECQRYDLQGKQILIGERKYYLNDLSFKQNSHSGFDPKINRIMENAVYLKLLRQGYQVYVGRFHHQEIDFVAEKEGEKIYIQVAYLLPDEVTIKREFGNLLLIQDNYPKWVVTLDDVNFGNINGVIHKQLWNFL